MHHVTSHFIQYMQLMYLRQNALGCWVPGLENQELGTLPTHPDCSPSLWTSYMMGLFYGLHIDHTFTQLHLCRIPNREEDAILVAHIQYSNFLIYS